MNLEIENLSFSYGSNEVIKDISFNLEEGECVAVLGENGVGKSTMLKCINRINRYEEGSIKLNGKEISKMNEIELARNVGYVSQNSEFVDSSVFNSVLLGRKPFIKWDVTDEDLTIVSEVLERMNLQDYAMRNVNELSGGEQQKVAIARVLAQQTPILLFDEPTSNLDLKNQIEVLDIIKKIVRERKLSALVTIHDLNLALRFADRFLMIKDGSVHSFGEMDIITPESIFEVYGVKTDVIKHGDNTVVIPY